MEKKTSDNSAVSPVIGVILMVAITVILAAVIGTFVVGIGEEVQPSPNAGVTFDYDDSNDNLTVRIVNSGNLDALYVVNQDNPIQDSDVTNIRGWESNVDGDNRAVNNDPEGGDSVVIGGVSEGDDVSAIGEVGGEETVLSGWDLE